jgi:hypothetical protein
MKQKNFFGWLALGALVLAGGIYTLEMSAVAGCRDSADESEKTLPDPAPATTASPSPVPTVKSGK